MPSPIGHSLAGYLIYRADSDRYLTKQALYIALFYVVFANLPDLDFIPGFLVGEPNKFHHGISHSLGFAVLFGLLVSLFLYWRSSYGFLRNFLIFFCLYFSHVFLYYLAYDTSIPYGVPLLWPLSSEYYISPISVFTDIERAQTSGVFISSLISLHNLWAVTVEVLVLLPIVAFILFIKRRANKNAKWSIIKIGNKLSLPSLRSQKNT